jgi:hypothetical protein
MASKLFVLGAIFVGLCMLVAVNAAGACVLGRLPVSQHIIQFNILCVMLCAYDGRALQLVHTPDLYWCTAAAAVTAALVACASC